MTKVKIVHFNPERPIIKGLLGKLIPIRKPLNNFGDLLGPIIVQETLKQSGLNIECEIETSKRLLTVGSILHLAHTGDTVWGSGRNGKVSDEHHVFKNLDVRAVRGPLTRTFLINKEIHVPEVYGDPALLLPNVMPELLVWRDSPAYDLTYIPNMNDYQKATAYPWIFNPRSPLYDCLERIARSRMVIGSSLHAIVVAESLGIPARFVMSGIEPEFKYIDYYLGTGRNDFKIAGTVKEAISLGGEKPISFSAKKLISAFPYDLWDGCSNV